MPLSPSPHGSEIPVLDILPPICIVCTLGNSRFRLKTPAKRAGGPRANFY
jgi:hypothetical protein